MLGEGERPEAAAGTLTATNVHPLVERRQLRLNPSESAHATGDPRRPYASFPEARVGCPG